MRVLLINAPLWNLTTEFYPPLGIAYLAAVLRHQNHEVAIVDMVIEPHADLDIIVPRYDIVGVYFNTVNFAEAIECIKIAKRYNKITIMGGPHASFNVTECMNFDEIDYVVLGEGEKCLASLLNRINCNQEVIDMHSLVYRKNGEVIINPLEDLIGNLDEIPFPARDLLPMKEYRLKTNDTSIIASRGCPYRCKFCAATLMGRNRYRRRSVENVVREMEEIVNEYGFERMTFFDDIFTLDKQFVTNLCKAIIAKDFHIGLSCETRVDCVNRELLMTMRSAGFDRIFFGVESGCQDILDKYNKGTTISQIKDAVHLCKDLQIIPILSFIIGLPDDTEDTIIETIDFAISLNVRNIWFQPFTPFPGTEAYNEATSNNLLKADTDGIIFEDYNLRSVVMGTKYLSRKQVEQLYLRAILSIQRGYAI